MVDFRFSNPTLVKSKNESHCIFMCDSSNEPPRLTDHKSEEKIEKSSKLTWWLAKNLFLKDSNYFSLKNEFIASPTVNFQYFFIFSSDLWSVSRGGSWELSHIKIQWLSFFDFTRVGFENRKSTTPFPETFTQF